MPSNLIVVLPLLLLGTSALLFWLWLLIVPLRSAMLCPEVCICDTGAFSVDCSKRSLNSVPKFHLTNVRVLFLSSNEINFLMNDSFVSLTALNELRIVNCGLRTIELGAFNGLT